MRAYPAFIRPLIDDVSTTSCMVLSTSALAVIGVDDASSPFVQIGQSRAAIHLIILQWWWERPQKHPTLSCSFFPPFGPFVRC
jgi:hypothetical protein